MSFFRRLGAILLERSVQAQKDAERVGLSPRPLFCLPCCDLCLLSLSLWFATNSQQSRLMRRFHLEGGAWSKPGFVVISSKKYFWEVWGVTPHTIVMFHWKISQRIVGYLNSFGEANTPIESTVLYCTHPQHPPTHPPTQPNDTKSAIAIYTYLPTNPTQPNIRK